MVWCPFWTPKALNRGDRPYFKLIRTTEKARGWKVSVHSKRDVYMLMKKSERSNYVEAPT